MEMSQVNSIRSQTSDLHNVEPYQFTTINLDFVVHSSWKRFLKFSKSETRTTKITTILFKQNKLKWEIFVKNCTCIFCQIKIKWGIFLYNFVLSYISFVPVLSKEKILKVPTNHKREFPMAAMFLVRSRQNEEVL